MKKCCKPNCKPTTQHSMTLDITSQDHWSENGELEHTLSHRVRCASMRVSELENRQARKRLEGSNPSPSAKLRPFPRPCGA